VTFKKQTLCPKRYYLSNQAPGDKRTPNHEGPRAMTLMTTDGDKIACPMNAGAVKKYSVKNKSSISRKSEKAA